MLNSFRKKFKTGIRGVKEVVVDFYEDNKNDLLTITDKIRQPIDIIIQIPKRVEEMLSFDNASYINIRRSIQIDDFTCGAQSTYSILDYYDVSISRQDLERKLQVKKNGHADEQAIYRLLKNKGLKLLRKNKATLATIVEAIDEYESPFLTTIDNEDHWIVVYGYSDKNIFVLDPSIKRPFVKWDKAKFRSLWDKSGIIVCSE